MIEGFENLDIYMRVQCHFNHLIQHGDLRADFEADMLEFCERDVTCIEEARVCVSISLAAIISLTPDNHQCIRDLVNVCLDKAESFLLFCDQKAGRV